MSLVRVHNFSISPDGFATGEGISAEVMGRGYDIESVASPTGITHLHRTRRT